ncbi:hypothetical protein FGG79_04580 [Bacillus sp. BHET2]|uniref:SWIM zinc finger family protein n=1 Tax=Bacillus sp. BHET2 TaxID=2583818 RepID=UPI00110EA848|nr:SWIM zinc finger family protein [Bacillus sp. BHET2]TMU87407.1 hypothetical protein FGG79_04580 [Bacillus sp. BHET2]
MHDFSDLMIEMEIHVNETIMNRGLTYYRGNRIIDTVIFPTHVHGVVNGKGDDYDTIVYLDQFEKSICTCPFSGYCKHIAALVFYLQDYKGENHEPFLIDEIDSYSKNELLLMIKTLSENNHLIGQAVMTYLRKEKQ